jgi:hypothetical protein
MKNLTTLELVETLSKLQIEKDYSIVAEPLIKMVDSEKVNILDRFISEINAERDSLIKKFKDFYFKKSNYQEFDEKGLSPAEIFEIIQKYSVRLERLFMIYKPDFSQTITKNSKNEEYDMVKINWIDEENKKIRILSKTYGKKGEAGLKFIVPKLITEYLEGTEVSNTDIQLLKEYKLTKHFVPDFLVKIGDVFWSIDIKKTKKNDFIKTAVRLELWERYKEIYT